MPREDKLGGIGRRIVCHKEAQKRIATKKHKKHKKKSDVGPFFLLCLLCFFVAILFCASCGLWSETNAGEDVCELPLGTELREDWIDFEVHQPDVPFFDCFF